MKNILIIIILILSASAVRAEATFNQVEQLIKDRNYQAATVGLDGIIANHPNSAKAFYAMAQAQAGLGDLEGANKALNRAVGIDPYLKFASKTNIRNLKQAITPQSEKIEPVDESSHFWLFLILTMMGGYGIYWLYNNTPKKPDPKNGAHIKTEESAKRQPSSSQQYASERPANPAPQPSAQFVPYPQTVVHNTSSGVDGLVTGMIIGDMLGRSHDTTIIHEKEIIHDAPRYTNDNSWEDTKKSSSWDDTSVGSSWESDSDSSSSWSDSSDSSSSWD